MNDDDYELAKWIGLDRFDALGTVKSIRDCASQHLDELDRDQFEMISELHKLAQEVNDALIRDDSVAVMLAMYELMSHSVVAENLTDIEIARKIREGGSKGGKRKAKPEVMRDQWQRMRDELKKSNPKLSKSSAARVIAARIGGAPHTIRQSIE